MTSTCIVDPVDAGVLIRRDAHGHFTIGALHGVPQIDCGDFEGALYGAGRVAAREASELWYASSGGEPRRVADVFTVRRLWNEYIDLPTLQLTRDQICRLLNADASTCRDVTSVLIEVGLLEESCDGTFRRANDGHASIAAVEIKRAARRGSR
jgi:hypothetical protein